MHIAASPFSSLRLLNQPFIYSGGKHWRWNSPNRNHYNLWICLEGKGTMQCQNQEYPFAPWTAFLLPPDMALLGTSSDPKEVPRNFSAHWLPRGERPDCPESALLGIALHEIDAAQALIQSLMRLSIFEDPLAAQQREWAVLQLLALLWREAHSPDRSPIDAVIYRQIEKIRSGQQLFSSVDALAREASLSRIHYSRRFRKITASSPNQFLINQRIERACVLLRETDWTIDTVASTIGYSDVYFFSRQFRQITHTTPRQYRVGSKTMTAR